MFEMKTSNQHVLETPYDSHSLWTRVDCLCLSFWEKGKWSCLSIAWVVKGSERERPYNCASRSKGRVEPVDLSVEPSNDEEAGAE